MKRNSLYSRRLYTGISDAVQTFRHRILSRKDTTMNRTVVVEQEYNPDILDASKSEMCCPKVERNLPSAKKEVEICHYFLPG